ncbi:MAG: aminopeptidase P family protein [Eubacterium sp.]|nr:aminopeptidase P family protein [Eubacterium sp.]
MYRQIIEQAKVDAYLVTDPMNMRYISRFRGGEGVLYISANRKVLVTDSRYTEQAGKESDFTVIEENAGHKRAVILAECINADKAEVLGFEDQNMRVNEFNALKEALPQVKSWVPLGGKVDFIRRIKTPEEVEIMAKAAQISEAGLKAVLDFIKPGVTELEVAAELEYQMKKRGANGLAFSTIVASGIHSSMPHAIPSEKKIENGDFITIDFGSSVNGYCSDMTRTIVVGKANDRQKEIYNLVLKAQLAGLAAVRPGVKGKEVDAVSRNIIKEAGYGDYFGHGLGHSVGLFIHENPRFSPAEEDVILPGMIETVEPGIYVPGFGGVRIEDMILITEDGYRNFNCFEKELIEL